MKTKKRVLLLVGVLLLSLAVIPLMQVKTEAASSLVSPALNVIAEQLPFAKSASGETVRFTAADFDRALGVEAVGGITVLSLPAVTDGKLMLGAMEVQKNQTISRAHLADLHFVPTREGVVETGFRFADASTAPYAVNCGVYLLAADNGAPSVEQVNPVTCALTVMQGASTLGTLRATDPEGDAMHFEITALPTQGVVSLLSLGEGRYRYTPVAGAVGTDSFSYVAVDRYGNRSAEKTVTVDVVERTKDITYVDLHTEGQENAVLYLAEQEIMVGMQVAGEWLFLPDRAVSRAEFLALAVHAAGYTVDESMPVTGFADEKEIPAQYLACVAVAAQVKLVAGEVRDDGVYFRPNDPITRAEAAVILARLLHAGAPAAAPTFSDSADIPVWAVPSVYAMYDMGVFTPVSSGEIGAGEHLTRGDTAEILARVAALR